MACGGINRREKLSKEISYWLPPSVCHDDDEESILLGRSEHVERKIE